MASEALLVAAFAVQSAEGFAVQPAEGFACPTLVAVLALALSPSSELAWAGLLATDKMLVLVHLPLVVKTDTYFHNQSRAQA